MSLAHTEVSVRGRRTEVLTAGEGEPLVFLHGGGIIEGFECLEPLAESFALYCPLMPGYGATELEPPVEGRDGVVAHIADVLDALGLDAVTLVGFSLGGWMAAAFAATHPERVRALVLAAPFGLNVPDHPMADVAAMEPPERLATLSTDPKVWEGRLPAGPDAEFEAARMREGQAIMRYMPGPFDLELPALLPRLTGPTLVLWGSEDRMFPVGTLEAWKAAVPHAASQVLPGAGHLMFHEQPAAVAAVADFAGAPAP